MPYAAPGKPVLNRTKKTFLFRSKESRGVRPFLPLDSLTEIGDLALTGIRRHHGVFSVEGKATSAALENSTGLASLSTTVTHQSEQINRVSGELDSLNTTAKVLEEQIRAAGSEARSAAVDASTAVSTLSTSLTGLTEQAVLVFHDVDALKFDSLWKID